MTVGDILFAFGVTVVAFLLGFIFGRSTGKRR